jgi:hypothetical protein
VEVWHTVPVKSAAAGASDLFTANALTVFAWLWAVGVVSHMGSYSEPLQTITVVLFSVALLVLFRPSTRVLFFALLAAHVAYVYDRLPHMPNHAVFAACVELTILSAAAGHMLTRRTWEVNADELFRSFAPIVRIEILVLYFFVVFHKLNSGFFDREHSCGAFMYLRLAAEYPFLPSGDWVRPWSIYLTILTEAAIPIMLVMSGLRLAGLLLAFGFHFALSMDPGDVVFNFSAALTGLFFLFLPRDFPQALSSTLAPRRSMWRHPPGRLLWFVSRVIVYLGVPALLASLIFRQAIATGLTQEASRAVWVVYAGFVFVTFVVTVMRHRPTFEPARRLLAVGSPWLLVFPALLIVNGFLPYLGGKTETSFAMYSNLRTEGGQTNHWLMPASLQVWDYQRDIVKIQRTSVGRIQRLANRGFQWTYFEFKWLMRDYPNASVVFERNGVVRRVRRVKDDPELMQPDSPLMRKLLKFRPIADWSRPSCIH